MMRTLRQAHLYLGSFFAPLVLYFSLSGAWQVFRLNDLPDKPKPPAAASREAVSERPRQGADDGAASHGFNAMLNELSKPHKNSAAPGTNPRKGHSRAFDWLAAAMGLGLFTTTVLGIALALQVPRRRRYVAGCLLAGVILPVLFLYLA